MEAYGIADFFWFPDEQGVRIEPLLPTDVRGMKRVDDRRVLSGIVHALKSGGRWGDYPQHVYGPKKTLYNRFRRWADRDVWERSWLAEKAACQTWTQSNRVLSTSVIRTERIGFVSKTPSYPFIATRGAHNLDDLLRRKSIARTLSRKRTCSIYVLFKPKARHNARGASGNAIVRKGSWRDHEAEIEAAYTAQVARLGKPETLWELGEMEAHIARTSQSRPEPPAEGSIP